MRLATKHPGREYLIYRLPERTLHQESFPKKDFTPGIVRRKRLYARNRSPEKTLRQELSRKNDIGSNNAGRNDTRDAGRRGFRPPSYNTCKIVLLT